MFNPYQNFPFYPLFPVYQLFSFNNLITPQYRMESVPLKNQIIQQCDLMIKNTLFASSRPTSEDLQEQSIKSKPFSLQENRQRPNSPTKIPDLAQLPNKSEQPKSRNILPNNINLILSYVRRINRSGKTVAKIIQKFKDKRTNFSVKKFYSYQLYIKDNLHNIVNKNALMKVIHFCDPSCAVFTLQEQGFYNMVCRTLIYHFLKEQSILGLLNSKKIVKTKRKHHLESYRKIIQDLKDNDSQ